MIGESSANALPRLAQDAEVSLCYERRGPLIHLLLDGFTHRELNDVILGLWATLDGADRSEVYHAMRGHMEHLRSPKTHAAPPLPAVAAAIVMGRRRVDTRGASDGDDLSSRSAATPAGDGRRY